MATESKIVTARTSLSLATANMFSYYKLHAILYEKQFQKFDKTEFVVQVKWRQNKIRSPYQGDGNKAHGCIELAFTAHTHFFCSYLVASEQKSLHCFLAKGKITFNVLQQKSV